jgi:hypothetical protein
MVIMINLALMIVSASLMIIMASLTRVTNNGNFTSYQQPPAKVRFDDRHKDLDDHQSAEEGGDHRQKHPLCIQRIHQSDGDAGLRREHECLRRRDDDLGRQRKRLRDRDTRQCI